MRHFLTVSAVLMLLSGCGSGVGDLPAGRVVGGDSPFLPGIYVGEVTCLFTVVSPSSTQKRSETDFSTVVIGESGLPLENGKEVALGLRTVVDFGNSLQLASTIEEVAVVNNGANSELQVSLVVDPDGLPLTLTGSLTDMYKQKGRDAIRLISSSSVAGVEDGGVFSMSWECEGTLHR